MILKRIKFRDNLLKVKMTWLGDKQSLLTNKVPSMSLIKLVCRRISMDLEWVKLLKMQNHQINFKVHIYFTFLTKQIFIF